MTLHRRFRFFVSRFSLLLALLAAAGCGAKRTPLNDAIAAMERYLSLVPDAPNARAARDKIYLWKGRIP